MAGSLVGVVMGSNSDRETMRHCVEQLRAFDVPCEVRGLSAHRTPDEPGARASSAEERGLKVIIAAQILARSHPEYREALARHRADLAEKILAEPDPSVG
jgi:phosphoribosylcarboxyaminoimidazole (NCAIR) mutase